MYLLAFTTSSSSPSSPFLRPFFHALHGLDGSPQSNVVIMRVFRQSFTPDAFPVATRSVDGTLHCQASSLDPAAIPDEGSPRPSRTHMAEIIAEIKIASLADRQIELEVGDPAL